VSVAVALYNRVNGVPVQLIHWKLVGDFDRGDPNLTLG
jgi:hypothetical protein